MPDARGRHSEWPIGVPLVTALRGEASALRNLRLQGSDVCNLPRLDHLAVAEVSDHSLIDPKAASCALDPTEARRECPGDDDTSHLHVAVHHHLLNVVANVGHGVQRIPPHRLLLVGTRCGESGWRVDDRVGMEQLIEGIKVACITCGQPAEHDRG